MALSTAREASVYLSYAWADGTPEEKERMVAVEQMCSALRRKGVSVHRDKTDLKPGDRISSFMGRLTAGDMIITVLSEKYLHSEYCMSELYGIYRRSQEPDGFLARIVPIVLPGARISRFLERLDYGKYWTGYRDRCKAKINRLGGPAYLGEQGAADFRRIDDVARNVVDMLGYINDFLCPREITDLQEHGYAQLLALLGRPGTPEPRRLR